MTRTDLSGDGEADPARNDGLKSAIRAAKRAMIPETYINRVLQYARQGFDGIEFPTYDTDWVLVPEARADDAATLWRKHGFVVTPTSLSGWRPDPQEGS